jgi:hypothetical protein
MPFSLCLRFNRILCGTVLVCIEDFTSSREDSQCMLQLGSHQLFEDEIKRRENTDGMA